MSPTGSQLSKHLQTYATSSVEDRQRFEYWQQATNSAFFALEAEQVDDAVFDGRISLLRANEIGIASVAADSQIVRRGYKQIRANETPVLTFICQTEGTGIVRQDRQEIVLNQGDLTFIDTERPHELRFDASFEQAVLQVPKQMMIDRHHWINGAAPIKLSGDEAISQIILANLKALLAVGASLPSAHRPQVVDGLIDLLSSAVGEAIGEEAVNLSRPRHMHLQRAKSYILKNLKNENLNPQMIADACNISTRYLRNLFAEQGQSLTAWIKMQRLESARMDIERKASANRTINQIAYRWGFSDYTHFCRSFKAAYGISPRSWRKQKAMENKEPA